MVRLKESYWRTVHAASLYFNSTNGAIKSLNTHGIFRGISYFNSTNGAIKSLNTHGIFRGISYFNSTNGAIKSCLLQ